MHERMHQGHGKEERDWRIRALPPRPCALCQHWLRWQSTRFSCVHRLGRRLLVIIPTTRTWHTGI